HDEFCLHLPEALEESPPRLLLGERGVVCLVRALVSLFSSVGQSFAGLQLLSRTAPDHRWWASCLQDGRVCCLAVPPPQTNTIAHRLWCGFVQYASLQRRLSGIGVSLRGPPPTSQRTLSIERSPL